MFQTLWLLVAYSYNIILVLFIATHLFVGAILSFIIGLYIGVYLSQNYEIPRINEPRTLWEKFLAFLERNRKDPEKLCVSNILQPSTIKELVLEDQQSAQRKNENVTTPKPEELQMESKADMKNIEESDQFDNHEEEHETEFFDDENMDNEIPDILPSHNKTFILTDKEMEDLILANKFTDISSSSAADDLDY